MFASKFYHILNLFEISVIHSTTENALHGRSTLVYPRDFANLTGSKLCDKICKTKLTKLKTFSCLWLKCKCIFFCMGRPRNDTDDIIHIVTATMATDWHVVLINNNTLYFTITEWILERWLVERYGLWEYRSWKWRNMSRSAGCFVFGFS